MSVLNIILHLSILLLALTQGHSIAYSNQANDKVIKLGMSAALSGPAKSIGQQLHQGSSIYFKKINAAGGINGAKVKLLLADDSYEPKHTVNNIRYFIYKEKVDALFGVMGTPTIHATMPLLTQSKTLLLMPFSGARFLHEKSPSNVFNLRASYDDEATEQIKYLVEELKHKKIGIFLQADEFGLYVESGLRKALAKYNLEPVKVTRYQRNSNSTEHALNNLKASGATAICLVGTYQPLAEFINSAQSNNYNPDYTSVSFSASRHLFEKVNANASIMVTEIVPNPMSCDSEFCAEFIKDMQDNAIFSPSRLHFEGYINAMAFSKAARKCQLPLQKKCLLHELNTLALNDPLIKKLFFNSNTKRNVYRSNYLNK